MLRYIVRRLLVAIPTLLAISLIVFAILDMAPGDPTSQLPLTIPPEVRENIRQSLGFNDPFFVRWWNWVELMAINEPVHLFEQFTDTCFGDCESRSRIISWQSRSPAMDTIYQRLPQTMWVLGLGLLFGVMIAVPIGTIQAYRQYSWFDNVGTFITMLGYSVPVFVIGPIFIWLFSVKLGWLPTFYKTTHDVEITSWSSIWFQIKQLLMPVGVLTLFNAATFGRFARAAVLENLTEGYVRTARSKGLSERIVMTRHVVRNSLIPVITLLALSIPGIFGGAIITENIFRINGLGQLLLLSIGQNDLPMVQSLVFMFAVLTVFFNIIADVLYGFLDPRIRYD
ncbi:MAG: ABC transporter permease subunit [Actinobacteria bacterium]|nr:ABC transporter permease subunit [Actinomycetota bacterium]